MISIAYANKLPIHSNSKSPLESHRVYTSLVRRKIGEIPLNPPFQGGLPEPVPPF